MLKTIKKSLTKLKIFFRRVSTENQSLEMQIAADKKFREVLDDDEYIELNELGVSANKVKMKDRKNLLQLIHLIEQGEVDTVYVYDRSRLTRNFYEYMELVDVFIQNDVKVVFTTTDAYYSPFSSNYLVEGVNGILIEEEGKGISRRIVETNRKLPARKFGYDIQKENGEKRYHLKEEYVKKLEHLFHDALSVHDMDAFMKLIMNHSFLLKKQPSDIIRILTDPFYAGAELIGKRFASLPHVAPVVTVEIFQKVQEKIHSFVEKIHRNLNEREGENILQPKCGICKNQMIYRKDKRGLSGKYTCSRGHQKVMMSVDAFNEMLVDSCSRFMESINEETLKLKIMEVVNKLLNQSNGRLYEIENRLEQMEMNIATLPIERLSDKTIQEQLNELTSWKKERRKQRELSLLLENYQHQIKFLVERLKMKASLKQQEILHISNLLLKDCFVYENTVTYQFYFTEFIDRKYLEGVS